MGLWKQFWVRNQEYHTSCLSCLSDKRKFESSSLGKQFSSVRNKRWGAVDIHDSSKAILNSWFQSAKQNHLDKIATKGEHESTAVRGFEEPQNDALQGKMKLNYST